MKNTSTSVFVIILLIIMVALGIYFITNTQDTTFKKVEIKDNKNLVLNGTEKSYYDTIVFVGLDVLGIKDVVLSIQPLSDGAKQDFANQGGELGAHIREHQGSYYLFIDETNKLESIDIIAHELIHLRQYENGELEFKNDILKWKGEVYDRTSIPYNQRPWEIDAEKNQTSLSEKIKEVLLSTY